MEGAKLVLPFASTIGIEAGIMGKKVIMESSAYYSGLPFAPQAISKQDYFKQIWESLDSVSFKQDETAVENALLVFYLSQICNRIQTNFVPEPPYFDKWVEHDFESLLYDDNISVLIHALTESLLYDDNISVLIHALTEGVPVAEIQNRRLLADNLRPESDKKDTESPAIQDIIADIFLHNAFFSLNHGKSFEALKLFEAYKKSKQEPNPLAEYGRAVALARLNRLGEAIQVIKQFLIAIPNHTKAEALLLKLRLIHPKTITTP
jgi:hypothetical protein